jgi:Apea-like HEPN
MAGDHVADLLAVIATELFSAEPTDPSLLADASIADGPDAVGERFTAIRQHRLYDASVAALREDPQLGDVLSKEPMVFHLRGGQGLPSQRLPVDIIESALTEVRGRNLPWLKETLEAQVRLNVAKLRQALQGGSIEVTTLVALSGLVLSAGSTLTTPWGIVGPIPWRPPLVEMFMSRRATAVLATTVSTRVVVTKSGSPFPTQLLAESQAFQEELERIASLLALSVALATEGAARQLPLIAWYMTVVPFQALNSAGAPLLVDLPRATPEPLTKAEMAGIELWTKELDGADVKNIDVAIRRVVLALSQRLSSADGLIDAVIAWENLFGTDQESTFRVTAALAYLLETDSARRNELQKKLEKVYGVRSAVVHGRRVSPQDVNDARTVAIDAAIGALGKVIQSRRDLIDKKPSDRGKLLILQAPQGF